MIEGSAPAVRRRKWPAPVEPQRAAKQATGARAVCQAL